MQGRQGVNYLRFNKTDAGDEPRVSNPTEDGRVFNGSARRKYLYLVASLSSSD